VSIIESLKKLVDPAAAQESEELRRVAREVPVKENTGAPPELVCRVCGHRSADSRFCPVCLAETMERVPSKEPKGGSK
jgi:rubrerythrin